MYLSPSQGGPQFGGMAGDGSACNGSGAMPRSPLGAANGPAAVARSDEGAAAQLPRSRAGR